MENSKPLFIVFEGIDGSGKSTLSTELWNNLNKIGRNTVKFAEPTQYETGLYIRKFLKGEMELSKSEQIDAFLKDREVSVSLNLKPNLENGMNVIYDRYYFSMAAYQSGEEFSAKTILKMNIEKNFPKPDFLFYIQTSPEIAWSRIEKRSEKKEHFESLEKLKSIHATFLEILPPSTIFVDGSKPISKISAEILEMIR